jgi:hypothetical protein
MSKLNSKKTDAFRVVATHFRRQSSSASHVMEEAAEVVEALRGLASVFMKLKTKSRRAIRRV